MALEGIRHLVECHCILPQFRSTVPSVYHKFIVFSVSNEDAVQPKLAQCNNCGIIHKVVDFCKSEIVHGLEDSSSLRTINDVKVAMPLRLVEFLVPQNLDISLWELIEFVLDNKLEKEIPLTKDDKTDLTQIKMLHIKSDGSFKIKTVTRQDTLVI